MGVVFRPVMAHKHLPLKTTLIVAVYRALLALEISLHTRSVQSVSSDVSFLSQCMTLCGVVMSVTILSLNPKVN